MITVHIPCVLATLVSLTLAIVYALELGKVYDLRLATVGQVQEIINPRIIRFGLRVGF